MLDHDVRTRMRPILGAVTSTMARGGAGGGAARGGAEPFVTVSRQAGAGGRTLSHLLVERLNALEPDGRPWQVFDHELVERVAADHQISQELVAALEDSDYSWLADLFAGLKFSDGPEVTEFNIYRRVSQTIRSLAQTGRVVIVGRGGAYVTRDLSGGVHVRLVAPLEYRVEQMARIRRLEREESEEEVRRIDRARQSFYRRYWPEESLDPERFTVTFNSAWSTDASMAEALVPLVRSRAATAVGRIAPAQTQPRSDA